MNKNDSETVFDENGCPEGCPCIDDYPNCYCRSIMDSDDDYKEEDDADEIV